MDRICDRPRTCLAGTHGVRPRLLTCPPSYDIRWLLLCLRQSNKSKIYGKYVLRTVRFVCNSRFQVPFKDILSFATVYDVHQQSHSHNSHNSRKVYASNLATEPRTLTMIMAHMTTRIMMIIPLCLPTMFMLPSDIRLVLAMVADHIQVLVHKSQMPSLTRWALKINTHGLRSVRTFVAYYSNGLIMVSVQSTLSIPRQEFPAWTGAIVIQKYSCRELRRHGSGSWATTRRTSCLWDCQYPPENDQNLTGWRTDQFYGDSIGIAYKNLAFWYSIMYDTWLYPVQ